jgi:LCP family protein required for cell wall assembly
LTAASLSLLFPGLGQYAAGARRRGVLIATPALVILTGVIGFGIGTVLGGGPQAVLGILLSPQVLVGVVAADLLWLAYHAFAILDAWVIARRARTDAGRATSKLAIVGLLAVLAVATLGLGSVAALGIETEDTLTAVFQADDDPSGDWAIPEASFAPDDADLDPSGDATASPSPTASPLAGIPLPAPSLVATLPPTPSPSPVPQWARDGRLNILLVGSDAGAGRWLVRTDTMVVLSVDVASGQAAMFGIPRNLINAPLPRESAAAFPDGRFPGLLNALYVYAWGHPSQFPGGEARGFRAVTGAVQELVGVPLDGFVAVDLRGFAKLVDAVKGIWIRIPEPLYDDAYPNMNGPGKVPISFRAGCQKLDGLEALAYARSRHQDSDYGRMRRQQLTLLALRRRVDPIELLERAPELLRIAKDHLWTTIKRKDLPSLAQLAASIQARDVDRVYFTPPTYPEYLTTGEIKQIRLTVRHVFDTGGGKGGGSRGNDDGLSDQKPCPDK